MFSKNVEFKSSINMSPWRKIAIGTWNSCGDPSVYGNIEFDASSMLKKIEEEKKLGNKITPTVFLAKAIAICLKEYPQLNSILRWGKLYERKTVDVFLQIAQDGTEDNLSGTVIKSCDNKSYSEIAKELKSKSSHIKKGDDADYKKMKGLMAILPSIIVKPIMNFIGFILYSLNIWSPLLNCPKDSFGSVMVTSVGMLGIDNGYAPLVPYSRCPILLAIGRICDKPTVINGKVEIRPMINIGVTLDHRHMDGKGASYILKAFRKYIESPK